MLYKNIEKLFVLSIIFFVLFALNKKVLMNKRKYEDEDEEKGRRITK